MNLAERTKQTYREPRFRILSFAAKSPGMAPASEVDIERVRMGGHLDQMKSVQAAESLQDYHRDREGHLMIRDDRPSAQSK